MNLLVLFRSRHEQHYTSKAPKMLLAASHKSSGFKDQTILCYRCQFNSIYYYC